jgi:membrane protein YqaA with SNARE-associated domain
MIVPMVVAKSEKFLKIALIATIFSVLGGLFGYFIGYVFFNEVGYQIFELYGYENINMLKEQFSTKGGLVSWLGILFTAGFTPLPFKIFTITSGFIHFNLLFFIFACTVARGLRFFLVAYLTYRFGSKFGPFLEKKGAQWTAIIAVIIIIITAGIYFHIF